MSKQALIIAIVVALILLWAAETLNMTKTSKLLGGAIDLGFAILRSLNCYFKKTKHKTDRYF